MANEDSYSIKEVIAEFRQEVKDRFDIIDNKVSATNGSVANIKGSVIFFKGALWVIGIVVTLVLIPLGVYYMEHGTRTNYQVTQK